MLGGLGANLALALIFLALRFVEWRTFNFTWSSDIHGSLVWTILFLHTFDVIADLIMTAVLMAIVASGRYGPKQRLGVHIDSVIWYFLVLIWFPLYATVYLGTAAGGIQMSGAMRVAALVFAADLVCQPCGTIRARTAGVRVALEHHSVDDQRSGAAARTDLRLGRIHVWQQQQGTAGMNDRPPMPPWLALSGMVLSASFFIVIAAQAIPSLMLEGCA